MSANRPARGLPADAPLKVAYLTYRGKPHVGGQGVYTRHLTKALVDLGHSVEVFGGQPYPVLDDRIPLHKLPSLDLWNDHYPGRFPGYWEIKTKGDVAEVLTHLKGTFGEPLGFSVRIREELRRRSSCQIRTLKPSGSPKVPFRWHATSATSPADLISQ